MSTSSPPRPQSTPLMSQDQDHVQDQTQSDSSLSTSIYHEFLSAEDPNISDSTVSDSTSSDPLSSPPPLFDDHLFQITNAFLDVFNVFCHIRCFGTVFI